MASPVAPRVWRPSAADTIEGDLAALWRDVASEGPVSRAIMSNLVVFCRCAAEDEVDLTSPPEGVPIDDVARNHPARVILLHHDPDASEAILAAAIPLAAHVAVLTFGPPDARYGVEQIVIKSACREAALPSIVRGLMLGDLPTSIWWTEDLSGTRPVAPLVTMGRQLLYDSRCWRDVGRAVLALAPLLADPFGPDLADVNWRRLQPVRQALVHALESSDTANQQQVTSVQIRHRPGEAALTWLLAGWLQSAWGPSRGEPTSDMSITVEEDTRLTDVVLMALVGDGLRVQLEDHQVRVEDAHGPPPFTMSVPGETGAEAVAAELRVLTHDDSLHNTLAALVVRFTKA
jgi:glucose-6-phosphate dehydrogenase-like protein OpcA